VFWRQGWRPRVRQIEVAESPWLHALHRPPSLGAALQRLEAQHPGLDLGAWLQEAVAQGLVLAVRDAISH
jgi:hypothetical protein